MSNPKKRVNINQSAMDVGAITSAAFNAYSGGSKVLPVGPEFTKTIGSATIIGADAAAGIGVAPGTVVYLYNNSGAIAWVTMSEAVIAAAPTGIADGIPLKKDDWTILSMGSNSYIRTSAATIGVYFLKDDSALRDA